MNEGEWKKQLDIFKVFGESCGSICQLPHSASHMELERKKKSPTTQKFNKFAGKLFLKDPTAINLKVR